MFTTTQKYKDKYKSAKRLNLSITPEARLNNRYQLSSDKSGYK